MGQEVSSWCKLHLDNLVSVRVGAANSATETIEQKLFYCGSEHGKLVAFRAQIQKGLTPPVLVFVQTKERAQELFKELLYDGIHVDVIHSERSEQQRENTVRAFRSGGIWVLICTEQMGRGIDFKGVNLVINYDFPPSAVSYIHRIGRTGRAGRAGSAVTFFTEADRPVLKSIAQVMRNSGCDVPEYMLHLKTSRDAKKKLEKTALKRDSISRESRYDRVSKKKRDEMIKASKKRKLNQTDNDGGATLSPAKKPKVDADTLVKKKKKKVQTSNKKQKSDKENLGKNKTKKVYPKSTNSSGGKKSNKL